MSLKVGKKLLTISADFRLKSNLRLSRTKMELLIKKCIVITQHSFPLKKESEMDSFFIIVDVDIYFVSK